MPIFEGHIGPIYAKDLRLNGAVEAMIPIPAPDGVHTPRLVSAEPLIVAQVTRDHARVCAQRLIDNMENLPHTEQAGDLLAMALTVLHYTKGNDNE